MQLLGRSFALCHIFSEAATGSIVCTPPLSAGGGGGGLSLKLNFLKGGGLDKTSAFRGGLLGKRGMTFFRGLQLSHKKSEIFNDKKVYKQKYFSVITKDERVLRC